MSGRNRPRGSIVKEDAADELQLWNTIIEKIRKCGAVSEKYDEIAARIPETEESVAEDDPSSAVISLSSLEEYHRSCLKHSEQLLKILNDEPDDLIKNLETLISVRAAFEVDTPPPSSSGAVAAAAAANPPATATATSSSRATPAPTGASTKPVRGKRKFDSDGTADGTPEPTVVINTAGPSSAGGAAAGSLAAVVAGSAGGRTTGRAASRSGSVAAGSVKSEAETGEAVKNVASDKTGISKLTVGSEVYFRNKDKRSEGEGILCRITNVIGEGKQRRYEIQDTEPDEGQEVTPWRASVTSLIPVPAQGTALPMLPKGKQVFALYPGTNTFYKAEMVGMRKDMCRIKFEGEEPADKEVDVERRHVLEYK